MIISGIATEATETGFRLAAKARANNARQREFKTHFEINGIAPPRFLSGDPFLAGFLIPCMWARESLHIDAPVSARLLDSVPAIQALIRGWYPDFGEIAVTAAATHDRLSTADPVVNPAGGPSADPARCAAFYSGGVDSWYTLLKHREAISHLVLVHGFDIQPDELDLWEKTERSLTTVARELGKTPVTVCTNLKRRGDPRWASWGRPFAGRFWRNCYQGSALAAVALCLQESIATILIPSSYPWTRLKPFGSHPELDPLWSSENLSVIHDGCEAGRLEKIQNRVGRSTHALRHLRVCLENIPGQYNCCRCEKCLRTMIGLQIAGVLDQSPTFERPLTPRAVRRLYLSRPLRKVYEEMREVARAGGQNELADALAVATGDRLAFDHLLAIAARRMAQTAMTIFPAKLRAQLKPKIGHLIK